MKRRLFWICSALILIAAQIGTISCQEVAAPEEEE